MYALLGNYVSTYVIDLPQRSDSSDALKYFLRELDKFKGAMEQFTGNKVTVEQLKKEIKSLNETRQLLPRLYDLRKMDPPYINSVDVLKLMQKQYFLSPDQLKGTLRMLIREVEQVKMDWVHKPRIMISGCPMPGDNTKVPEIIESVSRRVAIMARQAGLNQNVAFVGGVAKNVGIKIALEKELGISLYVPPNPQITGALGAALINCELK